MLSQPSKPTFFFDVKDLSNFTGQFVYNFYQVDEYVKTSYEDNVPTNLKSIPRYIKLNWTYSNPNISGLVVGNLVTVFSNEINDEANVVGSSEVKLQIFDKGLFSRILSTQITNAIITNQPENIKNLSTIQLLRTTVGSVDDDLRVNYDRLFQITEGLGQQLIEKFSLNLSKEFASTIIANSMIDPLCPFTVELRDAQSVVRNAPTDNRVRPELGDYVPNLKIISVPPNVASVFTDNDNTEIRHVGFRIIRDETDELGVKKSQKVFLISNWNETSMKDLDVRYGSTYSYAISPVFLLSYADYSEVGASTKKFALIAATSSVPLIIKAIDNTKPDAPIDIHYFWDYDKKNLYFSWSYPPDVKNRIVKAQIFRRQSIDEPFSLLKEYDFDKTIRNTSPFKDFASRSSYEKTNDKVGLYVDKEFNMNSKFIYAICFVDAHGNSSDLSAQFEVTFDRFKSSINTKLISRLGAMKHYPNMLLESDLFIDLLKDANHSMMELYFNPEVETIEFGSNKNNLRQEKTFLTSLLGNYKILTINTDLQKSEITTVNILSPLTERAPMASSNNVARRF